MVFFSLFYENWKKLSEIVLLYLLPFFLRLPRLSGFQCCFSTVFWLSSFLFYGDSTVSTFPGLPGAPSHWFVAFLSFPSRLIGVAFFRGTLECLRRRTSRRVETSTCARFLPINFVFFVLLSCAFLTKSFRLKAFIYKIPIVESRTVRRNDPQKFFWIILLLIWSQSPPFCLSMQLGISNFPLESHGREPPVFCTFGRGPITENFVVSQVVYLSVN